MYFSTSSTFRVLIKYVEDRDPYTWKGVVLALSLFLSQIIISVCIHNFVYYNHLGGARARTILNAVIYRKVQTMRLGCGRHSLCNIFQMSRVGPWDGTVGCWSRFCIRTCLDVIFHTSDFGTIEFCENFHNRRRNGESHGCGCTENTSKYMYIKWTKIFYKQLLETSY